MYFLPKLLMPVPVELVALVECKLAKHCHTMLLQQLSLQTLFIVNYSLDSMLGSQTCSISNDFQAQPAITSVLEHL